MNEIEIQLATVDDTLGIYNALKQNLVEISKVEEISKEQRLRLEEEGFLRKEVDAEYYRKLIEDHHIDIYIAKNKIGDVIGFVSIHKKRYDIIKVRDVIGELSFENEKTEALLLNESIEFAYLDQMSILPEYKRKGIGTTIFNEALTNLDTPVVAFIVEKPLFNKASIFWHEANGFEFSAISGGEYKGKEFKFQIFIHWNK
jgi:ribosomal protein S18 acetylase RimI-like enzyme